jgi:hypothetical protein
MPYQIKYRPRTHVYDGIVKDGVAEKDSAAAAWALVQQLEISDEKILEIRSPSGQLMSRDQLRELAQREAN